MLNKDNILRVKGILSAKESTQVPIFKWGGKPFTFTSNGQQITIPFEDLTKTSVDWGTNGGTITYNDQKYKVDADTSRNFSSWHSENMHYKPENQISSQNEFVQDKMRYPQAGTITEGVQNATTQRELLEKNSPIATKQLQETAAEIKLTEDSGISKTTDNTLITIPPQPNVTLTPAAQQKQETIDAQVELNAIEQNSGTSTSTPINSSGVVLPDQPEIKDPTSGGQNGTSGEGGGETAEKTSWIDSPETKKIAGYAAMAGVGIDKAQGLLVDKSQFAANDPTQGRGRQAYDAVANSLMGFFPVGTIAGGAMKAVGLVNDILGSSAKGFAVDNKTLEQVGGSYGGTTFDIQSASDKAGKKYGLFGSGARHKANREIDEAIRKQQIMAGIAQESSERKTSAAALNDFMTESYRKKILGGYNQKFMRAAKEGGSIKLEDSWEPIIVSDLEILKTGGTLEYEDWNPIISEEDFWIPDITEDTFILKEGGTIKESDIEVIETNTTQKSVIPEGALHKNKHHLDEVGIDDSELTKKGIPVVDNNGDQQAEIELNEIIFTLEVTRELEKRYKEFYEENTTADRKTELALEAGKLLWKEIIYNTDDRTGLIDTLKQGGTIGKESVKKPSFKEWFMSIPKESRASGYDYHRAYNDFDTDLLINHAKNPEKYHLPNVSPNSDERGWVPFLKLGRETENPEILGELDWLNSSDPEAVKQRQNYNLVFEQGKYWYAPKKKMKEGGIISQEDIDKMVKQALINLLLK